jgi:diguanylate cyclase (GGDEF)-like protein
LRAGALPGRKSDDEAELFFRHKDDYTVPVFLRISPIRNSRGRIVGAAEVFRDNGSRLVARQMIEDLEHQVLIDPLTKLGNRHCAEITLHARLDESKRYDWPFGILFIDLDHFKEVNDLYGHEEGDRVLKMVADTLRQSVRSVDRVCRWGGEEFIAIITNMHHERMLRDIAEKCRRRVQKKCLGRNGAGKPVTVSIGATLVRPEDTLTTLVTRGDDLMYQSKSAGRNKVSLRLNPTTPNGIANRSDILDFSI